MRLGGIVLPLESDLSTMLADFGITATHGAETGLVIADTTDEAMLQMGGGAALMGKMLSILCRTSDFPTLKIGDNWTVGGVAYTVADRMRLDDGLITKIICKA